MKKILRTISICAALFVGTNANAQFAGFGGMQQQANLETSQQWKDINYAGDDKAYHTLDIYLPKQEKAAYPVVVHIYGSAWFSNNSKGAADLGTIVKALLDAGYAVVCPNHRASGDAKWPAQIHDIKAVIRFIRGEAKTYKFDTSFIATSGFSSGGHLATFCGVTNGVKEATVGQAKIDIEGSLGKYTKESTVINAVCDWSGAVDVPNMDCGEHMSFGASSPEDALIGTKKSENPDQYLSASYTPYLDKNDVPVIVFHGKKDNIVPPCQGENLYEALKDLGIKTEITLEPEGGHGTGMYSKANLQKMVNFFNSVRK